MRVQIEYSDVDHMIDLFERRANDMVSDAVEQGIKKADNRATLKKAKVAMLKRRRVARRVRATEVQRAKWIESAMYYKLIDFFGDW